MSLHRIIVGSTVCLMAFFINDGTNTSYGQRRLFQIGGQNGVTVGGGNGLRIGGPRGVQLGGGDGLRFGPPGAGVQYGGGQGIRYGTPNAGVQLGAGQGFRIGTRRSGVQAGVGQGVRFGTQNNGLQFGNGNGVQVRPLPYPQFPQPQFVQPIARDAISSGLTNPHTTNQPVMMPSDSGGSTITLSTPATSTTPNYVNQNFSAGTGGGQIILEMPEDAKSALNYVANQTDLTLEPGKRVYFDSTSTWNVQIKNATGENSAFKLDTPGTYRVVDTSNGFAIENATKIEPSLATATAVSSVSITAEPTLTETKEQGSSILESLLGGTKPNTPASKRTTTEAPPALDGDGNVIESPKSGSEVPTILNLDGN